MNPVMISENNLMRNSLDWDWVDHYAAKMGDYALVKYSRELFSYLHRLPDDAEIIIEHIVKKENEDLFAKLVCRFIYEGTLNLCFSNDFKKLRKYELKTNKTSCQLSTSPKTESSSPNLMVAGSPSA